MKWNEIMLEKIASQQGKTILITGSNTGIGFETARLLALKGADIIIACRNQEKGQQALADLRAKVPGVQASLVQLDLANLESVRQCAAEIIENHPTLDALINNAGLAMPPLQKTADDFEMQFGTNVLGCFAFTGLLMPLLVKTTGARVVWLSSVAHWRGTIDFDNLNAEKGYSSFGAYAQSKLANLMLAYEMQRRLEHSHITMLSLAAHPGGTKSDLSRNNTLLKIITLFTSPFIQKTTEGAMPSMLATTEPELKGGEFFGPSGFMTIKGPAELQQSSKYSYDSVIASRLWQTCEQLTGVPFLN
jgi:NAD(P)-dependent dehydrogenase (short-subunit alcohol dehydrogenase family)